MGERLDGFEGAREIRALAAAQDGEAPMPGVGYLLDEPRARCLAARIVEEARAPTLRVTRAVIFLTERCNMACEYCLSTGHRMPPWDDGRLQAFLDELADTGTRHVHWTGGEPTLHPGLLQWVRRSARRGMHNSLSTNATAPRDLYAELAQAGVSRFSLSVDDLEPDRFDEITRSRGRLSHVLGVLGDLCTLRDRGHPVHVTVNTVLTRRSAHHLVAHDGRRLRALLAWFCECGADDFKLLPASVEPWAQMVADRGPIADLVEICSREVPARFRMFHRRLATIRSGGYGLRGEGPRPCYQCVDDRAHDSLGAYGCIVQLREGGAPVYRYDDRIETRKRNLKAFLHQDRSTDPICNRLCFDLYRDLNERVAHLLHTHPQPRA